MNKDPLARSIVALRPKLRAWAAAQPDAIRIRAGFVDKNLKELARSPNDPRPFQMLVANHEALIGMINANPALPSEDRNL